MGRITKAAPHLSEEEVLENIKRTVGFWRVQKWLVIWNGLVAPRPANEIALHTGLAEQTVHNLISQYNRLGPGAVEGPGKGGRRRSYLSLEQEAAFLEPFKQKALTGQIATATEIKDALEAILEHKVHKTTVYRILKRQGWRKVAPRPFHIQAKQEEQEA
ncbi:MAG: winged helix-turn-helix domain-containing protein [Deltaproteobacteria bacterium]|nr:winged helix-turn-helix domain-containing protein [Deltaproteobacteria bacterium]